MAVLRRSRGFVRRWCPSHSRCNMPSCRPINTRRSSIACSPGRATKTVCAPYAAWTAEAFSSENYRSATPCRASTNCGIGPALRCWSLARSTARATRRPCDSGRNTPFSPRRPPEAPRQERWRLVPGRGPRWATGHADARLGRAWELPAVCAAAPCTSRPTSSGRSTR
jgi:hypothetical protein